MNSSHSMNQGPAYQACKVVLLCLAIFTLGNCSSKPKITTIKTELKDSVKMESDSLGKNSEGQIVVQKKESLTTYLLDLQRDVVLLEQGIYGNKAYGNKGKYGVLEDCRIEARAKANGKWEMVATIPKAILSKEEQKFSKKMGFDEKGQLVLLSEEELSSRIQRFERYKDNYEAQDDWFDIEIKACKVNLNNYLYKKAEPVPVTKPFPILEQNSGEGTI